MGSRASLSEKGQDLFDTPGAELPGYVREVARGVMRQGKTKSQAIGIAIGMIKKWAAGGGGVNADTRAKAAKALVQWNAAKAKAHATPNKSDLSNPAYMNFLASTGVLVDFANADNKGSKKDDDKNKGKGKNGGKQRYKHGWIPVDENGKPTGPAEPPEWLKNAKAKHKAAGGKTAQELRKEAAAKEFKRKKEEAERPAKEAKEKREKAAREAKAKAEKVQREKEAKERKAETAANTKAREREALINKAYSQAIEDKKAGRALTPQQKAVVTHVLKRRRKERGKLRKVSLANDDKPTHGEEGCVNVLDLSSRFPSGQLAFRYKHNWILINPAIPSRGKFGGALARKYGAKSGTTTKGHFEPKAGGGKKFVPTSTGHATPTAVDKQLKALAIKSPAPHTKDAYKLAAAEKAQKKASTPVMPPKFKAVAEKQAAATQASLKAKQSGTYTDASAAAKAHADAFVIAKKANAPKTAAQHKEHAQQWAKEAAALKKAEAAEKVKAAEEKAAANAKAEADKKAAEEKDKAEKKAKIAELKSKADELLDVAEKMPGEANEVNKSKQFEYAGKLYDQAAITADTAGMPGTSKAMDSKANAAWSQAEHWSGKAAEAKQKKQAELDAQQKFEEQKKEAFAAYSKAHDLPPYASSENKANAFKAAHTELEKAAELNGKAGNPPDSLLEAKIEQSQTLAEKYDNDAVMDKQEFTKNVLVDYDDAVAQGKTNVAKALKIAALKPGASDLTEKDFAAIDGLHTPDPQQQAPEKKTAPAPAPKFTKGEAQIFVSGGTPKTVSGLGAPGGNLFIHKAEGNASGYSVTSLKAGKKLPGSFTTQKEAKKAALWMQQNGPKNWTDDSVSAWKKDEPDAYADFMKGVSGKAWNDSASTPTPAPAPRQYKPDTTFTPQQEAMLSTYATHVVPNNIPGDAKLWSNYMKAVYTSKGDTSSEKLKALIAAKKDLTALGVTSPQFVGVSEAFHASYKEKSAPVSPVAPTPEAKKSPSLVPKMSSEKNAVVMDAYFSVPEEEIDKAPPSVWKNYLKASYDTQVIAGKLGLTTDPDEKADLQEQLKVSSQNGADAHKVLIDNGVPNQVLQDVNTHMGPYAKLVAEGESGTDVLNGPKAQPKANKPVAKTRDRAESHLKATGTTLGSHGAKVMEGADGKQYLVKPQPGWQTDLDLATNAMQHKLGLPAPGMKKVTVDGKPASSQTMLDAEPAFPNGFDPAKLSKADHIAIQKQMAFDLLVGNHDAHDGQWLRTTDGELVAIDLGQSFKFGIGNDAGHTPAGNVGTPVYAAYLASNPPIQPEAAAVAAKIAAMPKGELYATFNTYAYSAADAGKLPAGKNAQQFLGDLKTHADGIQQHFGKQFGQSVPAAPDKGSDAAKNAKARLTPEWKVTLPDSGGMYTDGGAIKGLLNKPADTPAEEVQKKLATRDLLNQFEKKHGKKFDTSKVSNPGGMPFTPATGGHITNHPFYDDAKGEGYEPVENHVNANGGWKPSDAGLPGNKGAYIYSGGAYAPINKQLRHGTGPKGGENDAVIAAMDKEFATVPPLDSSIVVSRKMDGKGPFSKAPPYMQAGGVFVDHGYSSTSKDPSIWPGAVHMQVRVPAGTKVLDLNHTAGSQHSSEQEILLDRDTHYRVVSDGPNPGGSGRLIVVEVVPGPKVKA